MAWLKVSDTATQNPIVRRALDLPHCTQEYMYTLFGVILACAVEAAAMKTNYIIERNAIAAKVGLEKTEQFIKDAIVCGYMTETQLEDGRIAYKLVEDEENFFHMRSKEEIEWENRRRNDARNAAITAPVRARDGDACRWCGRVVYWGDQKSARGGTYDHLRPGIGAETPQDVIVACRSCNSTRKDNPEWGGTLLPAPTKPYYGRKTVEFLAAQDIHVELSPESEKPTTPGKIYVEQTTTAGIGSIENPQGGDVQVADCALAVDESLRARDCQDLPTPDSEASALPTASQAASATKKPDGERVALHPTASMTIEETWDADLEAQENGDALTPAPQTGQKNNSDDWHPSSWAAAQAGSIENPQGGDVQVADCALAVDESLRARDCQDLPTPDSEASAHPRRAGVQDVRRPVTPNPSQSLPIRTVSDLDVPGRVGSGNRFKNQGDCLLPSVVEPKSFSDSRRHRRRRGSRCRRKDV